MTIPLRSSVPGSGGSNTLTPGTIAAGDVIVVYIWFIGGGAGATIPTVTTAWSLVGAQNDGANYAYVFAKQAVAGDVGANIVVSATGSTISGSVIESWNAAGGTLGATSTNFQLSPTGTAVPTISVNVVNSGATLICGVVGQDPVTAGSSGLTLDTASTNSQPYKISAFYKQNMSPGATGVLSLAELTGSLEYHTYVLVIEPAPSVASTIITNGLPPEPPRYLTPKSFAGAGQAAQPPVIVRGEKGTAYLPPPLPQVFAGAGQAAQAPAIIQTRERAANYLPASAPTIYAGVLAAAAAGVAAQISAPNVPLPAAPAPALYAGSANDPGVVGSGIASAFLPDEAPAPVGPGLFLGVSVASPTAATIAFAFAPTAPTTHRPTIIAGAGQAAQAPVIAGSVVPPSAALPPPASLFAGFGAAAQVASVVSVPHPRPWATATAPALFVGAGQAAKPAVILGSPIAPFASLPPLGALAAGFGNAAQVATIALASSAPAPASTTTPAWFAGVIPPATTSGIVAHATVVQLQELPPRGSIAAGFGLPAQVGAVVSAPTNAPRAELPPQGATFAGFGLPAQSPVILRSAEVLRPVETARAALFAGFGQAAQSATVISAPRLPANAERFFVPILSAGAGQILLPVPPVYSAARFAPWVELPPNVTVRAGAGQPAQAPAVYSPQVLPSVTAPPPAGSLSAGVVPTIAAVAAVYQTIPPAAAALPPVPLLARGFGQAAQPPVIMFAVQHAPRGELPPMGALFIGVPLQPAAFILRSPAVFETSLPPASFLARGFGQPSQVATVITVPFVTTGITLLPPGTALFAGFGQATPLFQGPAAPPWCSLVIDMRDAIYASPVTDYRIT